MGSDGESREAIGNLPSSPSGSECLLLLSHDASVAVGHHLLLLPCSQGGGRCSGSSRQDCLLLLTHEGPGSRGWSSWCRWIRGDRCFLLLSSFHVVRLPVA